MTEKIFVTGAFGQIGSELVPVLIKEHGIENVIVMDIKKSIDNQGIAYEFDIRDTKKLREIIVKHNITTVYHLVSLLSVAGEANPDLCWELNVGSLKNILDLAKEFNLKVFWPSSIAAFGKTTPRVGTPQQTVLEPTTMYGATKVSGELLCQYYYLKYGVDVRSVRFPGIVSWKTPPSQGTTEYSIAMFYEGIPKGKYNCPLNEDTRIPMMYVNDAVKAAMMIMKEDRSKISTRTSYNISALSFTAKELENEIKKHIPLVVDYVPDERQKIADSWPQSLDDSKARQDWGWDHDYDLPKLTEEIIINLKQKLGDKLGEKQF